VTCQGSRTSSRSSRHEMREPWHVTLRHRGQAPSSYGVNQRVPKGRRPRPTQTPLPSRCLCHHGLAEGVASLWEVSCDTAVVKPAEHCNLPRENRQVRHRRPPYVCTCLERNLPPACLHPQRVCFRHLALLHHETPPPRHMCFSFFS
jgi:hypothetical protein